MNNQNLNTIAELEARPTQPSLAPLVRRDAPPASRQRPWAFPAAVVGALGLHLSLAAATHWAFSADSAGGGIVLDAIAVTIMDGKAFEARNLAVPTDGTTTTHPINNSEQAKAQPENSAAASTSTDTTKPHDATVLTTPDAIRNETVAQLTGNLDTTKLERPSDLPEVPEVPTAPVVQSSDTASSNESRGTQATSAAASAAQAAPPGVASAYARSVLSAVAKTRPKPLGAQGSARVRFTVEADGSVNDAAIQSTSGNTRLDTAAITAVQRAQFPAPPVALSRAETTFVLPFHFR